MTKENLDRGYNILYNMYRIVEILKLIEDKHLFITLSGPGMESYSFFTISKLIPDVMDANIYQKEILDNLKISFNIKIEKLKDEFNSL